MVVHATKLHLPNRRHFSDVTAASLDHHSRSLALLLSDSSLLLYPSLSLSPSPTPPPPTAIPPTVSAHAFLRLQPTPAAPPRTLLLAAGPLRSSTLLRAWILSDAGPGFARAALGCSRGQIGGDSSGVLLPLRHGFSVGLGGGVNVCALHSPAERRIWVMAARLAGDGAVSLVKCASIECTAPIYSMRVCMRVLILGEQDGVRVFPLRPLVKGLPASKKAVALKQFEGNGVDMGKFHASDVNAPGRASLCNGETRGFSKTDVVDDSSGQISSCHLPTSVSPVLQRNLCYANEAKRKIVKLSQDSGNMESFLVDLNYQKDLILDSKMQALSPLKAISIQPLSLNKFLILDSVGDVHILHLHKSGSGIGINGQVNRISRCGEIKHLGCSMKTQMLAAYSDNSEKTQTVWISDGSYSIHVLAITDPDQPLTSNNKEEKYADVMTKISVVQAIFSSEKIQDIVAYDAHSIIVLGQVEHSACLPELILKEDSKFFELVISRFLFGVNVNTEGQRLMSLEELFFSHILLQHGVFRELILISVPKS